MPVIQDPMFAPIFHSKPSIPWNPFPLRSALTLTTYSVTFTPVNLFYYTFSLELLSRKFSLSNRFGHSGLLSRSKPARVFSYRSCSDTTIYTINWSLLAVDSSLLPSANWRTLSTAISESKGGHVEVAFRKSTELRSPFCRTFGGHLILVFIQYRKFLLYPERMWQRCA